jgi:uncharacterized protein YjbI with pentapeptide repeats
MNKIISPPKKMPLLLWGSAVLVILLAVAVWKVPQWQASSLRFESPKERVEFENSSRDTLLKAAQTLGGLGFILTVYFTWRNLQVTYDKQVTERFSRAVEQLGSDIIEVRLGGIYSLERVAKDSPNDRLVIMEVLTSFIQEKSPLPQKKDSQQKKRQSIVEFILAEQMLAPTKEREPEKVATDIQAALTVIRRRDASNSSKDETIDLSNANLSGANLNKADLSESNLSGAILSGVNLSEANLSKVNLSGAILSGVNFNKAILIEANFSGANLSKAILSRANLSGANLRGANLSEAILDGAKFLNRANLYRADLNGADLGAAILDRAYLMEANLGKAKLDGASLKEASLDKANLSGANLNGADLNGADLNGADFRGAKNLVVPQVKSAQYWNLAKYDEHFGKELGLPPQLQGETQGVEKLLATPQVK